MIVIALQQDGVATIVSPQRLFQGTNSEKIFVLSPFPASCPVQIGAVLPRGNSGVDNGSHVPMTPANNTPYSEMSVVTLPAQAEYTLLSAWEYDPPVAWTAKAGRIYFCILVQIPKSGSNDAEYQYTNLTSYMVEATVEETLVPAVPEVEDVDAYAELLQIMASVYEEIYGNPNATPPVSGLKDRIKDIEDYLGAVDSEPTENSTDLVTSGGVWKAVDDALSEAEIHADTAAGNAETNAKAYADTVAGNAERNAKAYADTAANNALQAAKDYTDQHGGGGGSGGTVIYDTEGDPLASIGTDAAPTANSGQLVTSGAVQKATFSRVYKAITDVDPTFVWDEDLPSNLSPVTMLDVMLAMENNSYLIAPLTDLSSGKKYSALLPVQSDYTLGLLELVKYSDNMATARYTALHVADLTNHSAKMWYGEFNYSPLQTEWSGWKEVLQEEDIDPRTFSRVYRAVQDVDPSFVYDEDRIVGDSPVTILEVMEAMENNSYLMCSLATSDGGNTKKYSDILPVPTNYIFGILEIVKLNGNRATARYTALNSNPAATNSATKMWFGEFQQAVTGYEWSGWNEVAKQEVVDTLVNGVFARVYTSFAEVYDGILNPPANPYQMTELVYNMADNSILYGRILAADDPYLALLPTDAQLYYTSGLMTIQKSDDNHAVARYTAYTSNETETGANALQEWVAEFQFSNLLRPWSSWHKVVTDTDVTNTYPLDSSSISTSGKSIPGLSMFYWSTAKMVYKSISEVTVTTNPTRVQLLEAMATNSVLLCDVTAQQAGALSDGDQSYVGNHAGTLVIYKGSSNDRAILIIATGKLYMCMSTVSGSTTGFSAWIDIQKKRYMHVCKCTDSSNGITITLSFINGSSTSCGSSTNFSNLLGRGKGLYMPSATAIIGWSGYRNNNGTYTFPIDVAKGNSNYNITINFERAQYNWDSTTVGAVTDTVTEI